MRKIYCDGGGFLNLVSVLDADAGHLDIRPFKYTGKDPTSTVFEYFAIYLALTWIKTN